MRLIRSTNMGWHSLVKEQAREFICGKLGHAWKIALPVQIRDETKEVLVGCPTCEEKKWHKLPDGGYEQLKKDIADGKIK